MVFFTLEKTVNIYLLLKLYKGGDFMLRKKMSGSKDKGIFKKTAKSSKVINYVTVKRGGIRL